MGVAKTHQKAAGREVDVPSERVQFWASERGNPLGDSGEHPCAMLERQAGFALYMKAERRVLQAMGQPSKAGRLKLQGLSGDHQGPW